MFSFNFKKFFKPIVLVAIVLGLIFLNFLGALDLPKDFFYKVISPVQGCVYKVGLSIDDFVSWVCFAKRVYHENQSLRLENLKLKGEVTRLKELEKENIFLKKQLNIERKEEQKLIFSKVIGYGPQSLNRFILIDKGVSDGVKENMPVIIGGNILIGKTRKCFSHSCEVILIIDPSSKVSVMTQESRTPALLRGDGAKLFLDLVPVKEKVSKNETVITSGLDSVFPRGLLVGKIENIFSSHTRVFQQIEVSSPVCFYKLENVFVIIPSS